MPQGVAADGNHIGVLSSGDRPRLAIDSHGGSGTGRHALQHPHRVEAEHPHPEIGVHPRGMAGRLAGAALVAAEHELDPGLAELRHLPPDDRLGIGTRQARLVRGPPLLDLGNERKRQPEITLRIVEYLPLRCEVRGVEQPVGADRGRPLQRRPALHAGTQALHDVGGVLGTVDPDVLEVVHAHVEAEAHLGVGLAVRGHFLSAGVRFANDAARSSGDIRSAKKIFTTSTPASSSCRVLARASAASVIARNWLVIVVWFGASLASAGPAA